MKTKLFLFALVWTVVLGGLAFGVHAAPATPDPGCLSTQPEPVDWSDGEGLFCTPWARTDGNSLEDTDNFDCTVALTGDNPFSTFNVVAGEAKLVSTPAGIWGAQVVESSCVNTVTGEQSEVRIVTAMFPAEPPPAPISAPLLLP